MQRRLDEVEPVGKHVVGAPVAANHLQLGQSFDDALDWSGRRRPLWILVAGVMAQLLLGQRLRRLEPRRHIRIGRAAAIERRSVEPAKHHAAALGTIVVLIALGFLIPIARSLVLPFLRFIVPLLILRLLDKNPLVVFDVFSCQLALLRTRSAAAPHPAPTAAAALARPFRRRRTCASSRSPGNPPGWPATSARSCALARAIRSATRPRTRTGSGL